MRRSLGFVEKRAEHENEAQEEPNAHKNRSDEKISKIAVLDNGTLVESFKFLNYYQLAKNSFVSTKFWNLIRNNRHRLELLRVDVIQMRTCPANDASIKVFKKQLSPEEYNEWVILNQHSKQIPLEVQDVGIPSTQHDSKMYELTAKRPYKERNFPQWDDPDYKLKYRQWRDSLDTTVFYARTKLDHENWPLFQHFVRLLTDPFIFIRCVALVYQTEVLNLLAGAINSDRNCLLCETLVIHLEDNAQKFIGWIKDHVVCKKIGIYNSNYDADANVNANADANADSDDDADADANDDANADALACNSSNLNYDQELLDFCMTGANCTSEIDVKKYDLSTVIFVFVQKFMDLKQFDETQIVQSIKSNDLRNYGDDEPGEAMKRDYAEFIVKEYEGYEKYEYNRETTIFEFVNNDIGKKMQLTLEITYLENYHEETSSNYDIETCFTLEIKNL